MSRSSPSRATRRTSADRSWRAPSRTSSPLRPENRFLLDLDAVPEDVLRRTKLVFVNYPNNPTAAVAPLEYLERTVATCRRYGILLAYDNAYCDLTFDGYRAPSIFEIPGARDVALEFFSLSKSFSMTGWRIGFAVGRHGAGRCAHAGQVLRRHRAVPRRAEGGRGRAGSGGGAGRADPRRSSSGGEMRRSRRCARRDSRSSLPRPRCTCGSLCRRVFSRPISPQRALEETGALVLPGQRVRPGRRGILPDRADRRRRSTPRRGRAIGPDACCGAGGRACAGPLRSVCHPSVAGPWIALAVSVGAARSLLLRLHRGADAGPPASPARAHRARAFRDRTGCDADALSNPSRCRECRDRRVRRARRRPARSSAALRRRWRPYRSRLSGRSCPIREAHHRRNGGR